MEKQQLFIKVRFSSKEYGATAGLVLDFDRYDSMTIPEFSRLFPYSESMKMKTLEKSPVFNAWDEAFDYDFETAKDTTVQDVSPWEVKID